MATNKKYQLLCVECGSIMTWAGDHDDEDGDYSIVSNYLCSKPKCGTYMLVYHGLLEKLDLKENVEVV